MSSVSIAMGTFNGSRYIEAQLRSLAAQTTPPAELVVFDDGSADDTLAKVASFGSSAPFPVRIHRNKDRLGYRLNFMAAAACCFSPLIAFCDQDDVWRSDKLQRMGAAFDDPAVLLAHHDVDVVDAAGAPLSASASTEGRPGLHAPMTASPWAFPLGFTMVFRSSLLGFSRLQPTSVDPYRDGEILAHDQWIAMLAWGLGSRLHVADKLASYRLHESNAFGIPRRVGSALLERAHLAVEDRSQVFARLERASAANEGVLLEGVRGADVAEAFGDRMDAPLRLWGACSRLYRLRTTAYSARKLRDRARAFLRLVSGGAYGTAGPWSFGWRSLARDALLGVLFGPIVTRRGFPKSDRDASLRALAVPPSAVDGGEESRLLDVEGLPAQSVHEAPRWNDLSPVNAPSTTEEGLKEGA